MDWIEVCPQCKQPFSIVEVGGISGPRDREAIDCPRCKTTWGYRKSSGVFVTAALAGEQEENRSAGR
jgi:uncharacterized protein YbaR (Trm112 family)